MGGEAVYFLADMRSEYQIRTFIRRTVRRFGRIDVLCNNAGIQKLATIKWERVFTTKLAARHSRNRRR